jgi:hypothetical protein
MLTCELISGIRDLKIVNNQTWLTRLPALERLNCLVCYGTHFRLPHTRQIAAVPSWSLDKYDKLWF